MGSRTLARFLMVYHQMYDVLAVLCFQVIEGREQLTKIK